MSMPFEIYSARLSDIPSSQLRARNQAVADQATAAGVALEPLAINPMDAYDAGMVTAVIDHEAGLVVPAVRYEHLYDYAGDNPHAKGDATRIQQHILTQHGPVRPDIARFIIMDTTDESFALRADRLSKLASGLIYRTIYVHKVTKATGEFLQRYAGDMVLK